MHLRKIILVLAIFVLTAAFTASVQLWQDDQRAPLISNSRFISEVANGRIGSVAIDGGLAYVYDTKGGLSRTLVPSNQSALIADLQHRGVKVWLTTTSGRRWTWLLTLESKLRFGT